MAISTCRFSIWLPIGEHLMVALERSMRHLEQAFSAAGFSWTAAPSGTAIAPAPVVHGGYRNARGRLERDSHLVFHAHVPIGNATPDECMQLATAMEEELYTYYAEDSGQSGNDAVYQDLIFVEYWAAHYVLVPKRQHPIRVDRS